MANEIIRTETAGHMLGVPVRFMNVIAERGGDIIRNQTVVTGRRPYPAYGKGCTISAEIRFDDECKNGKNSFAITGEIIDPKERRDRGIVACGCLHEDIAKAFPELAPLIKWHLTDAAGPMHYIANTIYHAGDRDHHGKRAGEPYAWDDAVKFGAFPIVYRIKSAQLLAFLKSLSDYERGGMEAALIPLAVAHEDRPGETYKFAPKYQFAGQPPLKWYECPFDSEDAAEQFAAAFLDHQPEFLRIPTQWSEGKARNLDHARSVAVWPDATDAELMQEPEALKAALEARHAALMAEFKAAILGAGLLWDAR